MNRFQLILVALVLAVGALGCGGDDDATTPDGAVADSGPTPDGAVADSGPTPDDGGPTPDDGGPTPDDGGACSCVGDVLEFGPTGGKVLFSRAYEISPCRAFELTQTDGSSGAMMSCTNDVPCMGDATTIDDVLAALGDADVAAAFAAAPVLYGVDSRPVDGSVFRIAQTGKEILVGDACGSASGCTEIPAGVQALVDLLRTLTTERLAEEDCATVFPGG